MELVSETAPANDNFNSATIIHGTSVGLPSNNNWGARRELNEPIHPDGYGGRSVWYTWTAPTNAEHAVRVDIAGDLDHTLLAIFKGASVSQLTTVAHNSGAISASTSFIAEPGQKYFIRVEGRMGGTGDFALTFMSSPLLGDIILHSPIILDTSVTDHFALKVDGLAVANLKIEASTNLVDWVEIEQFIYSSVEAMIVLPADIPFRFFRASSK
jgi:hypothetical protein